MKVAAVVVAVLVGLVLFASLRYVNTSLAPLFLNSRIDRLGENHLPKILVERGNTIYCRMKADDFRFPLPPGSRPLNPTVRGGFDTADGSVEVRFEGSNSVTVSEYKVFLAGKVQAGGEIRAQTIPGGLLIKFHYFGDR
jgi:hypothetical protein